MGQLPQAIDPFLFGLSMFREHAYGLAYARPTSSCRAHGNTDAASNIDALRVIGPCRMDARYKPFSYFRKPPDASYCKKTRSRIANMRSEEHTSELQSLMRTSYAVFCLK